MLQAAQTQQLPSGSGERHLCPSDDGRPRKREDRHSQDNPRGAADMVAATSYWVSENLTI